MRAVTLLSRHSGEVSQASIRRFPWPQGGGHAGRVTLPVGRGKRGHPCAGNLFATAERGRTRPAETPIMYHKKIRPANTNFAKVSVRRPVRALSAGNCLMAH